MNLKLDKTLIGINGSELIGDGGKPLTLRSVIEQSLLASYNDEVLVLSPDEKNKRFKLARKVHNAKPETFFAVESVAMIKKLIGKGYGPEVVGTAYELIEGVTDDEDGEPKPAKVSPIKKA